MDPRMRSQYLVKTAGFTFLCDNCADTYILLEKRSKRSCCICKRLLPRGGDPFFGIGALHALGHMETEPFRVVQDRNPLVEDNRRLGQRTTYHHARSPAGVHANSHRAFHEVLPK